MTLASASLSNVSGIKTDSVVGMVLPFVRVRELEWCGEASGDTGEDSVRLQWSQIGAVFCRRTMVCFDFRKTAIR